MSAQQNSENNQQLYALRHSTEHVLMHAMKNLGYKMHMAMGPATEDGFYFDFEILEDSTCLAGLRLRGSDSRSRRVSEDDFPKIEKEMQKIIDQDLSFIRQELSADKARKLFKDNPYKQEWIDEAEEKGEKITVYWTGRDKENSFVDLCAGPHVESTGQIEAFKLLSIAGAYWRGDEKNKMLTRIYGTAFPTQKELDHYLWQQEEAKKRDHRLLGKQLEIYSVYPDTIGAGLPVWLPNGFIIRKTLEDYMIEMERSYRYVHIITPHIGKDVLFKTSGHLDFYKEGMFAPLKIDDEIYYLKPMNCPMGMMVYAEKPRSYRELPIKMGEFGTVYRYEKSGELSGLSRVRGFTQNDAHIFCTADQLLDEFLEVFEMLQKFYKDLGFTNYKFRLGLGNPEKEKFKYCGTKMGWQHAENTIREALKKAGVDFFEAIGEATFYGPKLDVQAIDTVGREESVSTIQIDFNLPEKFDLTYINPNGQKKQPFVIHRALIGSFERFFAFLIEYYAGSFPVWLHPTQVAVLPISEEQKEYAQKIADQIKEVTPDVRLKIDYSDETLQKKIRNAQLQKIPYMLVIGAKEMENKTINLRLRTEETIGEMPLKNFIKRLNEKIQTKSLDL